MYRTMKEDEDEWLSISAFETGIEVRLRNLEEPPTKLRDLPSDGRDGAHRKDANTKPRMGSPPKGHSAKVVSKQELRKKANRRHGASYASLRPPVKTKAKARGEILSENEIEFDADTGRASDLARRESLEDHAESRKIVDHRRHIYGATSKPPTSLAVDMVDKDIMSATAAPRLSYPGRMSGKKYEISTSKEADRKYEIRQDPSIRAQIQSPTSSKAPQSLQDKRFISDARSSCRPNHKQQNTTQNSISTPQSRNVQPHMTNNKPAPLQRGRSITRRASAPDVASTDRLRPPSLERIPRSTRQQRRGASKMTLSMEYAYSALNEESGEDNYHSSSVSKRRWSDVAFSTTSLLADEDPWPEAETFPWNSTSDVVFKTNQETFGPFEESFKLDDVWYLASSHTPTPEGNKKSSRTMKMVFFDPEPTENDNTKGELSVDDDESQVIPLSEYLQQNEKSAATRLSSDDISLAGEGPTSELLTSASQDFPGDASPSYSA